MTAGRLTVPPAIPPTLDLLWPATPTAAAVGESVPTGMSVLVLRKTDSSPDVLAAVKLVAAVWLGSVLVALVEVDFGAEFATKVVGT